MGAVYLRHHFCAPGVFVLHETDAGCASLPRQLARILYLYQCDDALTAGVARWAHVQIFFPGAATILGRTGNLREYFATSKCQELPLSKIVRTLDIKYCPVGEVAAWRERGGTQDAEHGPSKGLFWCRSYDCQTGRFEVFR